MKSSFTVLLVCFILHTELFSQNHHYYSKTIEYQAEPMDSRTENPENSDAVIHGDFFPTNTALSFRYKSNLGNVKGKITCKKDKFINSFENAKFSYKQTWFPTKQGIYQTRSDNRVLRLFGKDHDYPKPLLLLPFPIRIGKKWQWSGVQTSGEDTTKIRIFGEIQKTEVIETAAGIFNCIKVFLNFQSDYGSSYQITQWLASEIGLVKSEMKLNGRGIGKLLQKIARLETIEFELEEIRGTTAADNLAIPKNVVINTRK